MSDIALKYNVESRHWGARPETSHVHSAAGKTPPNGQAWIHEVKLDGFRAHVTKDGDRVRIFTRSGAECTGRLPRMVEAFKALPASSAALDGELCYIGADGPNFTP